MYKSPLGTKVKLNVPYLAVAKLAQIREYQTGTEVVLSSILIGGRF